MWLKHLPQLTGQMTGLGGNPDGAALCPRASLGDTTAWELVKNAEPWALPGHPIGVCVCL